MKLGERLYNKALDHQWSSEVYHKAKDVIEEKVSATRGAVRREALILYMKQQHPSLCLDNIKRPTDPQLPYWKELVDSAIQALKNENKVRRADNGWVWAGGVEEARQSPSPLDKPAKLAEEIRDSLEKLVELARKGKEEPSRPTHDQMVERVKEIGTMLGKRAEGPWGPVYKHDCVWKDNPYANPKLVWEVCDKGNLDKDIASLLWAVKNWDACGILVLFEESDFYTAQKKLAQESRIYPLKAEDVLKLHSLLQAGYAQAIRTVFAM